MTSSRILCQLKNESGELLGGPIDLPLDIDKGGLEKLCQALIASVCCLYIFFLARFSPILCKSVFISFFWL